MLRSRRSAIVVDAHAPNVANFTYVLRRDCNAALTKKKQLKEGNFMLRGTAVA